MDKVHIFEKGKTICNHIFMPFNSKRWIYEYMRFKLLLSFSNVKKGSLITKFKS